MLGDTQDRRVAPTARRAVVATSPAPSSAFPVPAAVPVPVPVVSAPARPALLEHVVDATPAVPGWVGGPALDEPAFPALVLVLLALFVVVTGRGDRRDPKLVRADLHGRDRAVGFS